MAIYEYLLAAATCTAHPWPLGGNGTSGQRTRFGALATWVSLDIRGPQAWVVIFPYWRQLKEQAQASKGLRRIIPKKNRHKSSSKEQGWLNRLLQGWACFWQRGEKKAYRRVAFRGCLFFLSLPFLWVRQARVGTTGVGDPEDLHHGLLKRDAWRIWVGWAASWRELG